MCKEEENQQYVPIPETSQEGMEVSPGGSLKGMHDKLKSLGEQTSWLKWLMALIIGVLFVGFLTMFATLAGVFTDTWRYNVNSYIDYQESAKESAGNFNALNLQLKQITEQLEKMEERFDELESEVSSSSENGS